MSGLIEKFNWANLRSADNSDKLPDAIEVLAKSKDIEELESAYWKIDNESVVQGEIYESALPVITCLLSILDSCSRDSRPYVLELIMEISCGSISKSEMKYGNINLLKNIRSEVLKYFTLFQDLLRIGEIQEKALCVDILGVCALEDNSLNSKVVEILLELKDRFEVAGLNDLVANWLEELGE